MGAIKVNPFNYFCMAICRWIKVYQCRWNSHWRINFMSITVMYHGMSLTGLYLCSQCISPLNLRVWMPQMARCTRYNIMWLSLSVISDRCLVFSRYSSFLTATYLTEILLKVALKTITITLSLHKCIYIHLL
jgi:hypothetical protein